MLNVSIYESIIRKKTEQVWLFFSLIKTRQEVCKVATEQTIQRLEQCPLEIQDQSEDAWP